MSAPWTFGRVLSGLLAVGGLIALVVGMFLSFISGDGDENFWGTQKVEMDEHSWTCTATPAGEGQVNQVCESGLAFGTVTDKGTGFPITVSLLGVGMIGVSVMLRLRPPAAAPAYQTTQQPYAQTPAYPQQTR
ncbi:hypothetical protein [Actinophytocola sp. NPDC049390]|uniref:hypothetical protein n=1 Tax=Actinophytocola sp. NPDC049390 TaxID=3363894 RepID=UPI0037B0D672